MPFQLTQTEIERVLHLPKWAQDVIVRMERMIKTQDKTIADLSIDDDMVSNVYIAKHGKDTPLPKNSRIEFILPDSMMTRNGTEYPEENRFTVKIADDVCTGGKMLEVYSNESIMVESAGCNIINIRPLTTVYKNFVGFKDSLEKD